MPSGLPIQDGTGTTNALWKIDGNNNGYVNLPTTPAQSGIAALGSVISDGIVSPSLAPRAVRELQSTDSGMLRAAILTPMFEAFFPGANLDTGAWNQNSTTMTITQSGGFVFLNSSSLTTINTNAILTSYRSFPIRPDSETTCAFVLQMSQTPQANTVMEWGLFQPNARATPADGVLFRLDSAGLLKCVTNFNGVENTQDISAVLPIAASTTYEFAIKVIGDTAYFYGSSSVTGPLPLLATLTIGTAGASIVSSWYEPVSAQIYNTGSVPALANQLRISQIRVTVAGDWPQRDHKIALVGSGGQGTQGQVGATLGSLANYANSTVPATATLSNTTAGYATLGGQFIFAATASAETDFALFVYRAPVGTASLPGKSYYVTGVRIASFTGGAAVATTATILQWSIATGSTAVSLATADGAGAKARRVFPLGLQSFAIAALNTGPLEGVLWHSFESPLIANAGEYIHIILKVPVGTATASQTIRGVVAIEGFWE